MAYDWISFTTDYGLADGFVAACTGVLGRYAPHARVIDVSHEVPAQGVGRGARVLAQTVPYLPAAVHLAVVDPGVGTRRRGIAVVCDDGVLVGPDNGLLVPAAEVLGGVRAAYELTEARFWLSRVTNTFHGRDIFAPVAARVASGTDPGEFGPPVPIADLVRPPEYEATVDGLTAHAEVVAADVFGNVQLALPAERVPDWAPRTPLRVAPVRGGTPVTAVYAETFAAAEPGDPLVLVDSMGQLSVAVNQGSAMVRLGFEIGAVLEIRPA